MNGKEDVGRHMKKFVSKYRMFGNPLNDRPANSNKTRATNRTKPKKRKK